MEEKSLAELIETHREKAGLTRKQLAVELGVNPSQSGRWEQGGRLSEGSAIKVWHRLGFEGDAAERFLQLTGLSSKRGALRLLALPGKPELTAVRRKLIPVSGGQLLDFARREIENLEQLFAFGQLTSVAEQARSLETILREIAEHQGGDSFTLWLRTMNILGRAERDRAPVTQLAGPMGTFTLAIEAAEERGIGGDPIASLYAELGSAKHLLQLNEEANADYTQALDDAETPHLRRHIYRNKAIALIDDPKLGDFARELQHAKDEVKLSLTLEDQAFLSEIDEVSARGMAQLRALPSDLRDALGYLRESRQSMDSRRILDAIRTDIAEAALRLKEKDATEKQTGGALAVKAWDEAERYGYPYQTRRAEALLEPYGGIRAVKRARNQSRLREV